MKQMRKDNSEHRRKDKFLRPKALKKPAKPTPLPDLLAQARAVVEERDRLRNELASLRAAALQASKAALAVVEQCHLIGSAP